MPLLANIPAPRRVLIIKPSALGDVVTAIPVLRGLRRTFGRDVHVAWLLGRAAAPLVAEDGELDEVVLFDRRRLGRAWRDLGAAEGLWKLCRRLRHGRYDWVLDLQGLFRSGFFSFMTGSALRAGFAGSREGASLFYNHTLPVADTPLHAVDRNIALACSLGIDARGEDFRLEVPPEGQEFSRRFVAEHGRNYVVVAPATRWQSKLYPSSHWHAVVRELAQKVRVVLVAAPDETHLTAPLQGPNVVDCAGLTPLPQLVGLISAARGVISCDSATMHIATALGVPQLALLGPTQAELTGPYHKGDSVLQSPVACRGCLRRRCSHVTCMKTLSPQEVVAAAERTLGI